MNEVDLKIKNLVNEFLANPICKDLPKNGFLAGGSISNWILYRYGITSELIVNDLDIFTIDQFKEEQTWTTSFTGWSPDLVKSRYNYVMKLSYDKWYKILKCSRRGLINNISIETQTGTSYINILENFDLDLCSVGYDLSTGEVLYTPGFLDFFNSLSTGGGGVFSLQNLNSPDKTLIRALKKTKQLSLKFNPNDLDFLTYLISEFPGFNRKTFSDKLAEDFISIYDDPQIGILVKNLRLSRREDIELNLKSTLGELDFKLWSLESNPNVDSTTLAPKKLKVRYLRSCVHALNLYKSMNRSSEQFKLQDDDFLYSFEYLSLTGWCDIPYLEMKENSNWIRWISKITSNSPMSFNFFRKLGMSKSIEFLKKTKNTEIWDNLGKILDTCPFDLVTEFVESTERDTLSLAYLEIKSRKSAVPLLSEIKD